MNTREQHQQLEIAIFEWLCRKYVQRADARQEGLGLQYTEAETHDLAEEIARNVEQWADVHLREGSEPKAETRQRLGAEPAEPGRDSDAPNNRSTPEAAPTGEALTDSEYLLAMIDDQTFAGVPEIRRHHERIISIAAKLAALSTHPSAPVAPEEDAYFRGINEGLRMAAESAEVEEQMKKPPCVECGAMTLAEANEKCRCAGDKDDCHGCRLWPDPEEAPAVQPVAPAATAFKQPPGIIGGGAAEATKDAA